MKGKIMKVQQNTNQRPSFAATAVVQPHGMTSHLPDQAKVAEIISDLIIKISEKPVLKGERAGWFTQFQLGADTVTVENGNNIVKKIIISNKQGITEIDGEYTGVKNVNPVPEAIFNKLVALIKKKTVR